jgi:poly(3-hydroxybutyrate) depolymerase
MKVTEEARPASPSGRRWPAALATAVAAVLAAAGLAVVAPSPASAATVDTNAWYVLVNRNSGKALDVYNLATNDGARITQWSRNNGNQQQWQFVDSGGGYYRVKSRLSGKVLDVHNFSTANGAAIVQWADHNGTNQQFRLADSDGGYVRLINRNSNKVLEVQGASTADGGNIVQYDDWNGANQQWQFVRVDGGTNPTPGPTTPPPPGGGTSGCGKAPGITSGTHTISSNGANRSFILRIPASYNQNNPYRLVFGLHWWGGTAVDVDTGQTVDRNTWSYYGLQRLANNSTIFVAPQGIGNGWANTGGEDVTFIDNVRNRIESALCVNTRQRFSIGFSYGGAMSYALACARPDVFRAVVVQSAPRELSGCSGGTQPVAYLGVHGIGDNPASARAMRDRFVRNNGCTAQSPREPAAGSLTHVVTTYSGCRTGYPVAWAAFDGGHIAAPQDGAPGDSGPRTWVPALAWNFFSQFQ